MWIYSAATTHRVTASVITLAHGCYSRHTDGQRTCQGITEEEAQLGHKNLLRYYPENTGDNFHENFITNIFEDDITGMDIILVRKP